MAKQEWYTIKIFVPSTSSLFSGPPKFNNKTPTFGDAIVSSSSSSCGIRSDGSKGIAVATLHNVDSLLLPPLLIME